MEEATNGVNLYAAAVKAFKRQFLMMHVLEAKGNLCRAAIHLGIHRSTMTRALRDAGLSREQVKQLAKEAA